MKYINQKTAIFTTIFFLMAAGSAVAQQFGGPGANRQGNPGLRLAQELALDEAQAAEVRAILEEAQALHQEMRAQARAQGTAIRDETHTAIMAVLSDDQQIRFEELLQLRTERWGDDGHGGRKPGGRRGQFGGGDCINPDCPNPDCPNDDG